MNQVALLRTHDTLGALAGGILRYGLVFFLLWFGFFKFTEAEAQAIQPLISNSPLMSWVYRIWSIREASSLIGTVEILIAVAVALRPAFPFVSGIGSLGAVGTFVVTLSFLVTTPGTWAVVDGFPVPANAGGFILKDVFLLGAALWASHEAWSAVLLQKTAPQASVYRAG